MTTPEHTQWLRDNSSGVYRPAAEAAEVIEQLQHQRDEAREELTDMIEQRNCFLIRFEKAQERMIDAERQRDRLEEALKKIRTTTQGYCYGSWESRLNGICNEALQSLTLK